MPVNYTNSNHTYLPIYLFILEVVCVFKTKKPHCNNFDDLKKK